MIDTRIFISYWRSQFYFAEPVAKALTTDGLDRWLDIHRIYNGMIGRKVLRPHWNRATNWF
jgi:hypothetical protein